MLSLFSLLLSVVLSLCVDVCCCLFVVYVAVLLLVVGCCLMLLGIGGF